MASLQLTQQQRSQGLAGNSCSDMRSMGLICVPGKAGLSCTFLLALPEQGRAGAGRAVATGTGKCSRHRDNAQPGQPQHGKVVECLGHSLLSPPRETWGPALPRHSQGSSASSLGGVSETLCPGDHRDVQS